VAIQIRIDQTGKTGGVAGVAREDLDLSTAVTLTAIGGVSVTQYQWSIIYAPPNEAMTAASGSSLSAPGSSATTITPDNRGTYLIELQVDQGYGLGARSSDRTRITFYAGPTLSADPASLPRRRISAFEMLEHNVPDDVDPEGNEDGWAREWEKWFRVIESMGSTALVSTSAVGTINKLPGSYYDSLFFDHGGVTGGAWLGGYGPSLAAWNTDGEITKVDSSTNAFWVTYQDSVMAMSGTQEAFITFQSGEPCVQGTNRGNTVVVFDENAEIKIINALTESTFLGLSGGVLGFFSVGSGLLPSGATTPNPAVQVLYWSVASQAWLVSSTQSDSGYWVARFTNSGTEWRKEFYKIQTVTDAAASGYNSACGLLNHFPDDAATSKRYMLIADGTLGGGWDTLDGVIESVPARSTAVETLQIASSNANVTIPQYGINLHAVIPTGNMLVTQMISFITQGTSVNARTAIYDASGNFVWQSDYYTGMTTGLNVFTRVDAATVTLLGGNLYYAAYATNTNGTQNAGQSDRNGGNSNFSINVYDPASGGGNFDPINEYPSSVGLTNRVTYNIWLASGS